MTALMERAAPELVASPAPADGTSRARLVSRSALLVSVASAGVAVTMDHALPNPAHIAAITIACIAYVVMLAGERRWGGLTIRFVVIATVLSALAAISVIPRNGDLWSYAAYGRMLGVYHVSPWLHAPSAFPHDPFAALVGRTWVHQPSVYGPVFTGVSGAAAALLGAGTLSTRLFYQGLAVLAVAGSGLIIWRQTRSAAAVAFLAAHPLIAVYILNPGRNDILVGFAMLASVALALRNRPGAAGGVGALGALVKVTGVVGIVSLVVTTAVRKNLRSARTLALAAVGIVGLGYVIAGPVALFAPMQTAGGRYSQGSAWSLLHSSGLALPSPHVSLAVLALLVLVVIVRHAHSAPGEATAASSGMLALGAAYTLPGYAAWGLPVAALDHRSRVSRIVAATGVVLLMIYEILRHPFAGPAGTVLHGIATVGGPLVMVVLVIAMLRTRAAGGRPATVEEQSPSGELGNAGRTTEESIMDHAELEPARIS